MAVQQYSGDTFVGLSTDSKPTNIIDGARFFESDTLKVYLKVNGLWEEISHSLIAALQELAARLSVLAGMANSGQPALRTMPIASVSTAVTGTVTANVSTVTAFGTGIPASEMAHDINNMTAIFGNIVNVVVQ